MPIQRHPTIRLGQGELGQLFHRGGGSPGGDALKKRRPPGNGAEKPGLFWQAKGQRMKLIAILLSILLGGFAFAQTGAGGGSASGGTSRSSASPGGAAGTNVNGTVQTNQGNSYGNSAAGSQTEGANRNPTNSVNDNSVPQTTGNPEI